MYRSILLTSAAFVLWGCASPSPELEQPPLGEGAVQETSANLSSDERTTEDIRVSDVEQESVGTDQGNLDSEESNEVETVDALGSDIRVYELTEEEKAAVMGMQKLLDSLAETKAGEGGEEPAAREEGPAEIGVQVGEAKAEGREKEVNFESKAAQISNSDGIEKPTTGQVDQVINSGDNELAASGQELRTRDENIFRSKYKLGTGDVISIRVFNEPDLSMERVRMTEAGSIQYVILGEINIAGLTTREVETLVENKLLDGYLRNPKVTVSVDEYRPYYIGGEVVKRGSYPYVPGMTVLKAITIAGGFAPRASRSKIFLSPEGMPEDKRKVSEDDPIAPGDIITVEESFF